MWEANKSEKCFRNTLLNSFQTSKWIREKFEASLKDIKALKTKAKWRQEPEDLISGEKSNYYELESEKSFSPRFVFPCFPFAIALLRPKLIVLVPAVVVDSIKKESFTRSQLS